MGLDYEVLPIETVDLLPEFIQEAVERSSHIPHEERQWQTYLNVLALCGFEEWLRARGTDWTVHRQDCSVLQPPLANAIGAVCNLSVNEFKLCLITMGSLTDEEVTLPRAVVDLPEFAAHFYVLVEVREESETAVVTGFLSYNRLVERRAIVGLQADEDWTYQLPLTWFEGEPDYLLLNLRCLEPTAIPLPLSLSDGTSTLRSTQLSQMRSQLEVLLPQLRSPERQLWQVLSWEQAAVVLTTPELLNWLYRVQTQQPDSSSTQTSLQDYLSDILQLLTQPAMNVGRWLRDELDELAQEVSWVLLPSLASSALRQRSLTEEFQAIATQLRQAEVEIPLQARGAYRDLELGGMPFRLYAITWALSSEPIAEWTLLLVLGATPGTNLPSGLQLRISDQTGILVEQALDDRHSDAYFFTRVVGTWDEKFIVTVSLTPEVAKTLPPFGFNPERSL
jgi:hypothetical protein